MAYLHEAWSVGFRFHGTVITRLRPSGPWSKCLETATLDPYYTDRKHVTICQVSLTFFRHGVYNISGFFSLLKWQLFIISKSSCALIACNYTFENVIIASVVAKQHSLCAARYCCLYRGPIGGCALAQALLWRPTHNKQNLFVVKWNWVLRTVKAIQWSHW